MNENNLRKILKNNLGKYGLLWFPARVKFHENDIFGAYDCVFYAGGDILFIQLTTLTNLSHRRNKIIARFPSSMGIPKNSYIYAWDDKTNSFRIENVYEWLYGFDGEKKLNGKFNEDE